MSFLSRLASSPGLYQAKDVLPHETTTHAVYSVKNETSNMEYVGESGPSLGVKRKENRDAIRLGHADKSAVAEHVQKH